MRHSNGKRSRGRSGRRPAPQQNINRAYDSNGPAGKLRGTAAQLVEKYVSLARDARVGRDRVLVENFLQHAEHYQRIMNEIMIAQGIEPEAIDDDEQGGYDEQPDGNVNPGYDASGNGGGSNGANGGQGGHGHQGNGGQQGGGYNGGQRQNNGGQQGFNQQRRDSGGQQAAPAQPQPVIAGADDQPDISPDVAVEVPPVSLTPPDVPSAPRAIRGRRRRPQGARSEEPQGEAAVADEPAAEE
ncbi:MAG: DUF4167 domain-containing protein [Sphingomonadales bacterium]